MKQGDKEINQQQLNRSYSSCSIRDTTFTKNNNNNILLPYKYGRSSSLSTTTTITTPSPQQNPNHQIKCLPQPIPLIPHLPINNKPSSSSSTTTTNNNNNNNNIILRSLFHLLSLSSVGRNWLTNNNNNNKNPSSGLGRKLTGTLFGYKKSHVCFAIQHNPRSDPVLLLQLPTTTSTLVKEMSSGLLRIALESKIRPESTHIKLFREPVWTMYCNGNKCGYAVSRTSEESDWPVLSSVLHSVSVGAGVIPADKTRNISGSDLGELIYMRAKFERVVGNRDSEAFYMLNPDGSGGPDLSIFLLRI